MTTKSVFSADFNQQDVIAYFDNAFGKAMTPPPMVIDDAANFRKDADAANIDKALHIGDYPNRIKVYDITLKPNCHIARARVGIKRLVTQLMDNYSYAILLFHYEDTANTEWRISWVTKGGSSNKTNAAKRYTFLCGAMHPSRTIVDRLSQISTSKCALLPDKITEAFSVETLSDAFFNEYKAFYEDIVQYICGSRYVKEGKQYVRKEIESKTTIEQRGIFELFKAQAVKENPKLLEPITKTDPEKREEAEKKQKQDKIDAAEKLVRDYVKKLLGRLVFIQFIAKKGWMGLKPTVAWGAGNEHFLLNLYKNASQQDKNDFVQNILKSILFDSLNNNPNGKTDHLGVKVNVKTINAIDYKFPYLNGGLFEETALDNLGINIPGYFFVSNEKDNNGRFYGDDDKNAPKNTPRKFFEVAKKKSKKKNSEEIENTPYPYSASEGLFEFFERYNFTIDENDSDEAVVGIDPEMLGKIFENLLEDNKDKGAFYTPKPVVEYMCQQSLIAYLQNGVLKAKTDLHDDEEKEIKAQIEQFVKTKDVEMLPSAYRETIAQHLKNVKICDPAIGSGAFPMRLLNELLACREALQSCGGVQELSRAELKKEIIQNNIYGVDIEEGAIEIARLRFWLSIVIDLDRPEPLPNFDFKFMQGNSLLESVMLPGTKKPFNLNIQEMQKGKFAFPHLKSALSQLHNDLDKFYRETDHIRKASMRGDIKKQVVEVLNAYVDYESSKMQDIAAIAAKTKEDFTCTDFFLWHTWFADVFDKGGFDIVIGNPPYINIANIKDSEIRKAYKKTYTTIRNKSDLYSIFTEKAAYLLRESGISSYIFSNSWMGTDSFLLFRKFLINNTKIHKLIYLPDRVFKNASVRTCIILYTKSKVNECDIALENYDGKCFMPIGVLKYSDIKKYANYPFNFEKGTDIDTTEHVLLGDISSITLGIKTSNDNKFISSKPFSEDSYQLIRGRNFQRYGIPISEEWIWYRPDLFMEKVGAGPRKLEYFQTNTKILIQDVAQEICATLDEHQLLCNDTINVIYKLKDGFAFKYVLALLNSHIVRFWHKNMFPEGLHVKKYQLKTIPIPIISSTRQQEIIDIVDKILSTKKQKPTTDTTNYERQIDALVYLLYVITSYEELLEIEGDKDKALQMLVLMTIHQQPNSTEAELIQQLTPTNNNAPFSDNDIQTALAALKNEGVISLNGNQLKFK